MDFIIQKIKLEEITTNSDYYNGITERIKSINSIYRLRNIRKLMFGPKLKMIKARLYIKRDCDSIYRTLAILFFC